MGTDWNKLIEQYLTGELNAEQVAQFEKELANNPGLLAELELHRQTQEVLRRSALRQLVKTGGKSYFRKKVLKYGVITLMVLGAISAGIYLVMNGKKAASEVDSVQIEAKTLQVMEKFLEFDNIDPQYFQFTGEDDVFLTESGVLLSATDESFMLDGKPYDGPALIQWQEAQEAADIVKAGLSTMSGDKLLETQGMFSMKAFTPGGKPLELSNTGVYVQVPVDEIKEGMKLFQGVKGKNGAIDWQNPKELERLPQAGDMREMDLYPPDYEPKLNELKWFKEKQKRDSLYLSFDDQNFQTSEEKNRGKQLFNMYCSTCHFKHKDGTGPKLYQVRNKWKNGGAKPNSIYDWVIDWSKAAEHDPYALMVSYYKPTAQPTFVNFKNKKGDIDAIFDYIDESVEGNSSNSNQLNLSSASLESPLPVTVEFAEDKAKWTFNTEETNGKTYVVARVQIEKHWHINSLYLPNGSFGYPTSFQVMPNKAYQLVGKPIEPKAIEVHDEVADEDLKYHEGTIVLKQEVKPLVKGNIPIQVKYAFQPCDATHCLAPYEGTFSLGGNSESGVNDHIPPSKVLAIWRPKFNGTILATRDFEKRMQAIHRTCDQKVLEVYTRSLSEPLWKKDERVVGMGYPEFKTFAAERIGAIKLHDKHAQNLTRFYESVTEILHNKGKREVAEALAKERKWDEKIKQVRQKNEIRKGVREQLNLHEEYDFNLKDVCKQLGKRVGFQMHGGGTIVNIDKYVWDATVARQSTTITDPETGKTAQIVYEPFSLEVQNALEYEKLFVYLFPKEMNSYQRLDTEQGHINYQLNGHMNYTGVVVGINETGVFLYELGEMEAKEYGLVNLKRVSDQEFRKKLLALNQNRVKKPMGILDEVNWLFTERTDYSVQRKRRDNEVFRNAVRPTVYPCAVCVADSTVEIAISK